MLLEVPLYDGTSVLVEVDQPSGGPVKVGRGDVVGRATQTLQDALQPLVRLAASLTDQLRAADPAEVTVAFGVKFTAESGVVLSKISGEANLTVTLHWDRAAREAR